LWSCLGVIVTTLKIDAHHRNRMHLLLNACRPCKAWVPY
jgi:hypothetical protein